MRNQPLNLRAGLATSAAAVTAAVIAAALVTVPPDRLGTLQYRTESAAVQLAAAVVAELDTTAPPELVADTADTVDPVDPVVLTTGGPDPVPVLLTATPTAAAAGNNVLTSIGRAALTVTGVVLSPLWYLAFPITLPITVAAVNAGIPLNDGDFGVSTFARFFGYVLGWIGFPFLLPSLVFPTPTTPAVAPATSVRAAAAVPAAVSAPRPAAQRAHAGVTRRAAHAEPVRSVARPAAAKVSYRAAATSSAPAHRDAPRTAAKQHGSRVARNAAGGAESGGNNRG